MPSSMRIAVFSAVFVLAASSAATLRTAPSPERKGPALSVDHQLTRTPHASPSARGR
jgi:hypothetical protein